MNTQQVESADRSFKSEYTAGESADRSVNSEYTAGGVG